MHKYWYYRERLKHFVIPGCNYAESNMAGITNKGISSSDPYGKLDFGQNGVYFGYYLGILATEYYLLKENNQNMAAARTEMEVVAALEQYINYMDKSEHFWTCNGLPQGYIYNGFFTRQPVPDDFLYWSMWTTYATTLVPPGEYHGYILNYDVKWNNTFNGTNFTGLDPGHPGLIGEVVDGALDRGHCNDNASDDELQGVTMSQDEATGILMGLVLVYRCMESSTAQVEIDGNYLTCKEAARDIALKIIDKVCQGKIWKIETPCGHGVWSTEWYSYGWARAAQYFHDAPPIIANFFDNELSEAWYALLWWLVKEAQTMYINGKELIIVTGGTFFGWWGWWFVPDFQLEEPTYNSVMANILAAVGDSWDFFNNRTYEGLVHSVEDIQGQAFYILLYKTLHPSVDMRQPEIDLMKEQLACAPGEGPYFYGPNLHPPTCEGGGWSSTYKWRQESTIQNNGAPGNEGNYSGCDFMLAYNMWLMAGYGDYAHVKYLYHPYENILATHFIPYYDPNFHDTPLQGNLYNPLNYCTYETINSGMQILNSTRYYENHDPITDPLILEAYKYLKGEANFVSRKEIWLAPGFTVEKGAFFSAKIIPDHFFWSTFGSQNYGCDKSIGWSSLDDFMVEPCYNPHYYETPTLFKMAKADDELSKQELLKPIIFPNPTSNKITIVFNDQEKSHSLKILNMEGLILYNINSIRDSEEIDLASFPVGTYTVQIISNKTITTSKIVKI